MYLSGVLSLQNENISFLLKRKRTINLLTSWEKEFFDGTADWEQLNSSFIDGIRNTTEKSACGWLLVSRNENVVFDASLLDRLTSVIQSANPQTDLLVSAGGLGLDGKVRVGSYSSDEPSMRRGHAKAPIVDATIDLYLLNLSLFNELADKDILTSGTAFEPLLILSGWQRKMISYYHPELNCGIYGKMEPRDGAKLIAEWGQIKNKKLKRNGIKTLIGDINCFESADNYDYEEVQNILVENLEIPSFSIIARTQFKRPTLLHRLIVSLERAFSGRNVDFEIILTTDLDESAANSEFANIKAKFGDVPIELACNSSDKNTSSRVSNLLHGVEKAENEYIWVVDDDDYVSIEALTYLEQSFVFGNRPMIFATCDVVNETWDIAPSGKHVLSYTELKDRYHADRWPALFTGVNPTPVCGFITPSYVMKKRLREFEFRFDLSEDYTILLMIMTAPDLPPISEVTEPVAFISLRANDDNVVNMPDRSRWVIDITGFLSDLYKNEEIASRGTWQILSSINNMDQSASSLRGQCEHLMETIQSKDRELENLREINEIMRKESMLVQLALNVDVEDVVKLEKVSG